MKGSEMTFDEKTKLAIVKQCKKCPWKVSSKNEDIPNYDRKKHESLGSTIWDNPSYKGASMACHDSYEGKEFHCVGWINNQVGRGNNINLRMQMFKWENAGDIEVVGKQHETFDDTLKILHE